MYLLAKFHLIWVINTNFRDHDTVWKAINQSGRRSLIKYVRMLPIFELRPQIWLISLPCKFHQNPITPSKDIMWKAMNQSGCRSLTKYARMLPIFKLRRRIWLITLSCKFHLNLITPSKDIVQKATSLPCKFIKIR